MLSSYKVMFSNIFCDIIWRNCKTRWINGAAKEDDEVDLFVFFKKGHGVPVFYTSKDGTIHHLCLS